MDMMKSILPNDILPGSLLFGIGLGVVLSQLTNLALSSIRSERQPDGSGIYNTTRQLGSSPGTAIIGTVLALGFALGLISGISGIPSALPPSRPGAVGNLDHRCSGQPRDGMDVRGDDPGSHRHVHPENRESYLRQWRERTRK